MDKRKNDDTQSRSTGMRLVAILLVLAGVIGLLGLSGTFSTGVFANAGESVGQAGENIGEAFGTFGENAGAFFGNFGENIVNLLPLLLVGVGLFLLLYRPRPQLEVLDSNLNNIVDGSEDDANHVYL